MAWNWGCSMPALAWPTRLSSSHSNSQLCCAPAGVGPSRRFMRTGSWLLTIMRRSGRSSLRAPLLSADNALRLRQRVAGAALHQLAQVGEATGHMGGPHRVGEGGPQHADAADVSHRAPRPSASWGATRGRCVCTCSARGACAHHQALSPHGWPLHQAPRQLARRLRPASGDSGDCGSQVHDAMWPVRAQKHRHEPAAQAHPGRPPGALLHRPGGVRGRHHGGVPHLHAGASTRRRLGEEPPRAAPRRAPRLEATTPSGVPHALAHAAHAAACSLADARHSHLPPQFYPALNRSKCCNKSLCTGACAPSDSSFQPPRARLAAAPPGTRGCWCPA